jgi:hypothetical protein
VYGFHAAVAAYREAAANPTMAPESTAKYNRCSLVKRARIADTGEIFRIRKEVSFK